MGTIYLEGSTKNLEFDGFLLAQVTSSEFEAVCSGRFHSIAIYSRLGGGFVVEVSYKTQWQGESSYSSSEILSFPEEVRKYLHTTQLPGQSDLDDENRYDIKTRFAKSVTKVLQHLEVEWGFHHEDFEQ